jgi:hypothetical protein
MTYAEYLRSNGASDADIAVLDTPIARKAYEAMEARVTAAAADVERAATDRRNLEDWFETKATPYVSNVERAATLAKANEARALALVRDLGARGVLTADELKALGVEDAPPAPPTTTPPAPDTSKFVTLESMRPALDTVGNNLAAMQDLVLEHALLFPDKPLQVRALRQEANAKNMDLYAYWEQKYAVPAARTTREEAQKKAHDDAIRAETRKAVETEFASRLANPDARPLVPSTSPLAYRPTGDRAGKQPWEVGNADSLSNERVTRVATKIAQQGLSN